MAQVTVCIPAYRAARFIRSTLESVRTQSFTDICVEVAVEPADEATAGICDSFVTDPRFNVRRNATILGWPGNLRAILRTVSTPFFMILPHDDVLPPNYVEVLLEALQRDARTTVAYGDMWLFGQVQGRRSLALEKDPLSRRLLSFYLAGAEGVPWRGVTRTDALDKVDGFPSNDFGGFAVEGEWALHLLLCGRAQRVERALYFKRILDPAESSVSSVWSREFAPERLQAALEHHRDRMLSGFDRAPLTAEERRLVTLACEAAMLRRYLASSAGRVTFDSVHLKRADDILREAGALRGEDAGRIRALVLTALSRNRVLEGNLEDAEALARQAIGACSTDAEALAQLGRTVLRLGQLHEALQLAVEASRFSPGAAEPAALLRACAERVNDTFPMG